MLRVAFGQGKMIHRPIAGILHLIVYIGFIVINIEELLIDRGTRIEIYSDSAV